MGKKLENALNQIDKLYGKGSIMELGGKPIIKIPTISTGSIRLDKAIGIGGFPRGRISEIFGPESSGKTTLSLHLIAEAQKDGLKCAFIDAEHALDLSYAKNLKVNVDEVLLSQPDWGEQGLDIVEILVETGEIGLIIIDSVAALVPKSEIEGDYGDAQMGTHARMMSQAMRKLTAKVHKSNTCVVFINQIRMKIGVVFGNPEDTTGGKALKFYSSLRLETRYVGQVKQDGVQIASLTKITVKKNKLAPPFRKAEVEIRFGKGIDFISEIIDMAVDLDMIQKGGAWYTLVDNKFNGKEKLRIYLEENSDVVEYLRDEIMNKEVVLNGRITESGKDDEIKDGDDLD